MSRTTSTLCCALLALLAGSAGTSTAAAGKPVSVSIEVVTTTFLASPPPGSPSQPTRTTQAYTVTCNPAGGNLPLAASVCEDIRRYPTTMLGPPAPEPYPVTHECSGLIIAQTILAVTATANGTASTFSDDQGCHTSQPPYDASLIYGAAIARDKAGLGAIEPGLRCVDDPAFLCVSELAAAIRQAIGRAYLAHAIARLNPFGVDLFPTRVGEDVCTIQIGPITDARLRTGPRLSGHCSLAVEGLETRSSKPTVVFTEEWPVTARATASHTWRVLLDGFAWTSRVVSVTQSGPVPPQLWG